MQSYEDMTKEKNHIKHYENSGHSKSNIDRICYLFLIFLIGCLVGWVSEVIYFLAADGVFQNRGVLYGPWLPIYGVGHSVYML